MSERPCVHCGRAHDVRAVFCPTTGRALDDSVERWIGARVGPFTIEGALGAGAHGIVFRARDDDGQDCALKVLNLAGGRDHDRAHQRFEREIRATQSIRSRHVVRVIDAGHLASGAPWLAMELIEGESLRARLEREGRLPIDDAVSIATAILDALEAAHAAGVVHRDVKPENVLLARERGGVVPKLADFGLAREQDGPQITAPGSVVGTPRYIAPELARGKQGVDARSDLWSVGVLLYEALAGLRPFDRPDVISTLLAILSATPERPSALRPELPDGIEACVLRAMEKDPARRFQSASEMKMVLRAAAAAEMSATQEMDAMSALDETDPEHLDRTTPREWRRRE